MDHLHGDKPYSEMAEMKSFPLLSSNSSDNGIRHEAKDEDDESCGYLALLRIKGSTVSKQQRVWIRIQDNWINIWEDFTHPIPSQTFCLSGSRVVAPFSGHIELYLAYNPQITLEIELLHSYLHDLFPSNQKPSLQTLQPTRSLSTFPFLYKLLYFCGVLPACHKLHMVFGYLVSVIPLIYSLPAYLSEWGSNLGSPFLEWTSFAVYMLVDVAIPIGYHLMKNYMHLHRLDHTLQSLPFPKQVWIEFTQRARRVFWITSVFTVCNIAVQYAVAYNSLRASTVSIWSIMVAVSVPLVSIFVACVLCVLMLLSIAIGISVKGDTHYSSKAIASIPCKSCIRTTISQQIVRQAVRCQEFNNGWGLTLSLVLVFLGTLTIFAFAIALTANNAAAAVYGLVSIAFFVSLALPMAEVNQLIATYGQKLEVTLQTPISSSSLQESCQSCSSGGISSGTSLSDLLRLFDRLDPSIRMMGTKLTFAVLARFSQIGASIGVFIVSKTSQRS